MRPIRAGGRATGAGGCFAVSHKGIAAAKVMTNHSFHEKAASLTLGEIAELTGAQLAQPERAALRIEGLAVIGEAGPSHLTFLENAKYAADLDECHAGACFVAPRLEARLPPRIAALRTAHPQRAFVAITRRFYPSTLRPEPVIADSGVSPQAAVHPTARLEDGVVVEPFAVIGANVEIGAGTVIGAGAAIGREVSIDRAATPRDRLTTAA
jgi:UDP-3-O-[3-hydroxymyristoyl] glucosamine N-acyltransferase